MMTTRRIVAVTILAIMGVLQLWDSHVFTAGAGVVTVAAIALMLPVGTLLFSERVEIRVAAVVACALLLLFSKALAPHPLPALGVIAVIAAGANALAAMKPAP
jgi:uncharacterized membrane protein